MNCFILILWGKAINGHYMVTQACRCIRWHFQHIEGSEVTEAHLRYDGFREGDLVEPCLTIQPDIIPCTSAQAS